MTRVKNRFNDFQVLVAAGFDCETLKHDISFQVLVHLTDLYGRVEIQAIMALEHLKQLQSEFVQFYTVLKDTLEYHGNLSISDPEYQGIHDLLNEQYRVNEEAQ